MYSQSINSVEELTGGVLAANVQIREDREVFYRVRASMARTAQGTTLYHASRITFSAFTVNKLRVR
jgi:hypothetical protein